MHVEQPMILAHGSPQTGFTFIGPVNPNDPDLEEYTDTVLSGQYWWYLDITSLPAARAAAGLTANETPSNA